MYLSTILNAWYVFTFDLYGFAINTNTCVCSVDLIRPTLNLLTYICNSVIDWGINILEIIIRDNGLLYS